MCLNIDNVQCAFEGKDVVSFLCLCFSFYLPALVPRHMAKQTDSAPDSKKRGGAVFLMALCPLGDSVAEALCFLTFMPC